MTDIKNIDIDGKVIFTSANDDDTIKQAVEQAVRDGANLRNANLRDAILQDADLKWADLENADLQRAKLQGADLSGANLGGAKIILGNRTFKLEACDD